MMVMFCKALSICIFAGIGFIDCCLVASASRYNRKLEQQGKTNANKDNK